LIKIVIILIKKIMKIKMKIIKNL